MYPTTTEGHMFYPIGVLPDTVKPGDFILTRRDGTFMGTCIRFFQDFRLPLRDAKWSHAALVIDERGYIQEALEFAVEIEHIEKYRDHEVMHYSPEMSEEDREQVVLFSKSVYAAKHNYGYLTILSLVLSLLTGSSFVFSKAGTSICSGFVAEALTRAGYVFDSVPSHVTPGDLNKKFRQLGV